MDQTRFDGIAAALGGAATRRAGLRAALAVLVGGVVAPATRSETEARPRRQRGGAAERAGVIDEKRPCGPKPKDNRCRKHKDCCTRYCKPPKGKAKVGRCRCVKPGKKCRNGQTCCGGAICRDKRCTPAQTCGAAGGACASDANCCDGLICRSGSCAPCAPDVCASGCAFTTVNAAYAAAPAGGSIYIGAGNHPTGFEVTKDITIAACPGVTGAVLEPDRTLQDSDSYYVAIKGGASQSRYTVTLRNLTLTGGYPTDQDEALLSNVDGADVDWVIDGCQLTDAYLAINSTGGSFTVTKSTFLRVYYGTYFEIERTTTVTFTDVDMKDGYDGYVFYIDVDEGVEFHVNYLRGTVSNNLSYFYADSMNESDTPSERAKTTLTFTDTVFKDQITNAMYLYGGVVTLTNCSLTGCGETPIIMANGDLILNNTTVSGNTGEYNNFTSMTDGGGIRVRANDSNASLTLGAGTKITNNTAQAGAGLLTDEDAGKTLTLVGVNNTTVFGNIGPNCSEYIPPTNPEVVNCNYT